MANTNYPQELVTLVEEYLTDGIISVKERQVLLKKAQQLGVDVDEFDLYIDAQQQKVDQAIDAATAKKRGKTCPFCGRPVPQLSDKCPHCGEIVTAEASEELQEIFDHLEEALVCLKTRKDSPKSKAEIERYSRKAKMYYENNPKVQKLLSEINNEVLNAEEKHKVEDRKDTAKKIIRNKWFIVAIEAVIFFVLTSIWVFCNDSMHKRGEEAEQVLQEINLKYGFPSDYRLDDEDILSESKKSEYLKKVQIEEKEEEEARKKGHTYASYTDYRALIEKSEKLEKVTKEDWKIINDANRNKAISDWDDTAYIFFIISLFALGVMIVNIIYFLFFKK